MLFFIIRFLCKSMIKSVMTILLMLLNKQIWFQGHNSYFFFLKPCVNVVVLLFDKTLVCTNQIYTVVLSYSIDYCAVKCYSFECV